MNIPIAFEEQFKKDCKVINMKHEYPGYTGTEQWGIITSLSEEELCMQYETQIAPLRPYILLGKEFGQIRDDFNRNEKKHQMRGLRNGHAFDFEESVEEHHPEIAVDDLEDDVLHRDEIHRLWCAINQLPPIQRKRLIKHFFDGKSSRVIAKEEGINYSKVDKTITIALKNLKKVLI